MPVLHVNYDPPMTRSLVEKGYFLGDRFRVVEVGVRGGADNCWDPLGDQIHVFGFEPDEEECRRLNEIYGNRVTAFPYALGSENGEAALISCSDFPSSSSTYGYNPSLYSRLIVGEKFEGPRSLRSVTVRRLDMLLEEQRIEQMDFLKMDAEGSEMDILLGAGALLDDESLLGVFTEVRFHPQYFLQNEGRRPAVFSDLEAYLRDRGFFLYDLDLYRCSRRALPQPFLYDFIGRNGDPYPGPTIEGQVMSGDALFFRDPVGARLSGKEANQEPPSLAKLACLFEIFGLNDCAIELVLEFQDKFGKEHDCAELLDLLTPPVKGKKLSYSLHMESYRSDPRRFRPRSGTRFPEYVVSQYDGTYTPPWAPRRTWTTLIKSLLPLRVKEILKRAYRRMS